MPSCIRSRTARILHFALFLLAFVVPSLAAQQPPAPTIEELLDARTVTVELPEGNLLEALTRFGEQTGIHWSVDPAAIASAQDVKVVLIVSNLRARRFLDLLLGEHDLGYRIDPPGLLVVTTRACLQGKIETRVFDLGPADDSGRETAGGALAFADAKEHKHDRPAPVRSPFPIAEDDENRSSPEDDALVLIKENVAPGSWDKEDHSLQYHEGLLVARHTPQVLSQVESLVRTIQAHRPRTIELEWGVVEIPAAILPAEPAGSPGGVRKLMTDRDRKTWRDALAGPSATWRVRRSHPLRLVLSGEDPASAGAVRVPATAGASAPASEWAESTIRGTTYRVGGRTRAQMDVKLKLRLPTASGESEQELRFECDLGDGDFLFLPLGREGNVMRAWTLSVPVLRDDAAPPAVAIPAANDAELATLRAALQLPVKLAEGEATLAERVAQLRAQLGCNIHIAPLGSAALPAVTRQELDLGVVPGGTALSLLARACGIEWRVTPGVILLGPMTEVEPVLPVQILDYADLVRGSVECSPPALVRAAAGPAGPPPGPFLSLSRTEPWPRSAFDERENAPISREALPDLVKQTTGGNSWYERFEDVGVSVDRWGLLWIRHTAPVVADAVALLDRLRAEQSAQYRLEYRIVAVPRAEAAGGVLSPETAEAWWKKEAGPDAWPCGALTAREDTIAYASTVDRDRPGGGGIGRECGCVLGVRVGRISAERTLPLGLLLDLAQVAAKSVTGGAGDVDCLTLGFDGRIEPPLGGTLLLVLGELPGDRSLVVGIRVEESR